MSKPIKAALLSALVFPGAGHFFLKKYITGALLIAISLTALAVITSNAANKALQIAESIQLGEVQLDIAAITELVSKQSTAAGSNLLGTASWIFIVAWLIGVGDSYFAGREQDNAKL